MNRENTMTTALTTTQFKDALPKTMRKRINDELVQTVNDALTDEDTREYLRDNILSYVSVMQEGRFKVLSYVDAVKYVSYKVMGDTNLKAYEKVFPDKIADWRLRGVEPKDINSYVTAYNKTKLVNLIYAQTMVPIYVLNQDKVQCAINTLTGLMNDVDVSPKVRSDSAIGLLTHLKAPETAKVELDLGIDRGSVIDDYEAAMRKMVETQKEMIRAGGDLKDITNASIKRPVIEGEVNVVNRD